MICTASDYNNNMTIGNVQKLKYVKKNYARHIMYALVNIMFVEALPEQEYVLH